MMDKRIKMYIEQHINTGDTINIVIAGCTCSGKTTLAKEIRSAYKNKTDVTVIHQDDYYKNIECMPCDNKGNILADHISAFYTEEFTSDIRSLMCNGSVNIPVYNIKTNTRISKDKTIFKGKINIFEGLHTIELLKSILENSICVYMNTSNDICLERRVQRDYTNYGIEKSKVLSYWERCIEPTQNMFVLPQKNNADIVVEFIKGDTSMTVREMYDKLISVKRAFDLFGDVDSETSLRKQFKEYSKIVHPDGVQDKDRYIAVEAFQILNRLYNEGKSELEAGIYGVVDPIQIYKSQKPLFNLSIKGKNYDFYENMFEGDVAYVYRGICNGELIYMKLCMDSSDNELLENEYRVLSNNKHQLLPYVEEKIKVNGCTALIMREVTGVTMPELLEQYPKGIPAEHVMWMLERLLNVVGWLHSNKIVHGNIKPENIIIDKSIHKVTLMGLAFSISNADSRDAHYAIVNDYFTAPEVDKNATVTPNSDIYSVGKIAIKLLGGNVVNNGMPINIDVRIREFVRKLCNNDIKNRPGDAWKLWDELIKLRTDVYGKRRFLVLE